MFKNEAKANLINLCPSVTFNVLLTSVFLVVFSCFSFAQNVGIGVDDPSTKLDVDGVITATGGNSSDWNEAYSWGNHNLGGYLLNELDPKVGSLGLNYIPRWNGFTLINGVILDNGSNVGIGGAPRSEKLYVAGTSYLRGNIGIGTPPTLTESLNILGNTKVTGSGYITGNVGIGAPSNSSRLYVNGSSNFQGNLTTTGFSSLLGNVGIGSSPNGNRLYVNGPSYFQGNSTTTGSSSLLGNVGIGSPPNENRLYVNGTANISGPSQLSGNVGIGVPADPTYKLYVLGNTFNAGNTVATGTGYYNGNVGIGTPPTANKLQVNGNTRIEGNVGLGKAPDAIRLDVNGSIRISGAALKPGGGAWSNSSDRRLKKDIRPYEDGLDEVLQVNAVNYKYNELSGYDTNQSHVGVIAQELKEIAPYMVSDHKIGGKSYLQVDPSAMTYMLVNAIQEQQEEINELEARLAEKDAAYNDLNDKVDSLLKQMIKLEASMASKADTGNVDHIVEK